MNRIRQYELYFLNLGLIIWILFKVVPNLSTDISNYTYEIKTLASVKMEKSVFYKNFGKQTDWTLILTMKGGSIWKVSEVYEDFWPRLRSKENIGKEFKLYTAFNSRFHHNPIQIEIENEVIYDSDYQLNSKYILIVLTLLISIDSVIKLRKEIRKYKADDNNKHH